MLRNSVTVFERDGLWVVSVVEHCQTLEREFLKEEFARTYAAGQALRIEKEVRQRT
ncbi:hypothetical protein [Rhizobium bangladeshense]|uniref:hypothetical protein n=1 Tax=Rhizobium bangladeshense TaxID=1138189 RepID=UPI000A517940|nr:hypothetical protein [Rhizobium bangladeshense]